MINTVYRLARARKFEIAFEDIELFGQNAVVRPTHLSICNADMRYYLGTRDAKIMAEKLPLVLIHEGVGKVIYDPSGKFNVGEMVVMVPMNVAAFTEIVSVSIHAISRFDKIAHSCRRRIGVWGDGNLGYITSLLIKKLFPETEVYIFGTSYDKLSYFTFADGSFMVNEVPKDFYVDHAFECVGGNGSTVAIEQIIATVMPEATISILGVSEYPIPINTRMILEKGLRFFGSSRSGVDDFRKTVELYKEYPEIIDYLGSIVSSVNTVSTIDDIIAAFEKDAKKAFGKTIIQWQE